MIALEGTIRNNTVVFNNDVSKYDGSTVIVTILDNSFTSNQKANRDENAQRAAQKSAEENDSFHKILQLKKGFHFDKDFDAEKELAEALEEKYGSFA